MQVYDPNFQHKGGGKEPGGGGVVSSQEGKLNMIRVKRLKFTLKGSNYEDAQNTSLGSERKKTGLAMRVSLGRWFGKYNREGQKLLHFGENSG